MRLYHVPFHYGMTPASNGEDAAILSDQKLRMDVGLYQHERNTYGGLVKIRQNPDADYAGKPYYTDDDLSVTTRVYSASVMRGVLRIWIGYEAPDDTSVGVRLTDGTTEYFWDGAWTAASVGDWSTPAEVVTNVSSWTLKALGLVFNLVSDTGSDTPTVYGADAHFSLEFGRRSTGETFPDAWIEDAVTRTFLRSMRDGLEIWTTQEFAASSTDISTLSFASGSGERPFDVREVQAVYAVDTDDDLESPIPGTWNSSTKVWTFTDDVAAGTRLLTRMMIRPETAFVGDSDYTYTHLPLIGIEGYRSTDARYRSDGSRVGGNAASVYLLEPPKDRDLVLDVSVLAATPREVGSAAEALQEWIGRGIRLVSSATGFGFGVKLQSDDYSVAPRGKYFVASFGLLLQGVVTYMKQSEEKVTVQLVTTTVQENDLNVGR